MHDLSLDYGPDPDSVNTTIILTDRMELRPAHRDAAADLFALLEGERGRAVTDNLLWDGPDSIQDIVNWGDQSQRTPFRDWGHHWSIHDLDGRITGRVGGGLGAIGIGTSAHNGRGDIGYWLGEPYWGLGLMTEAVEAVVTHGFTTMNLVKIDAGVFPWNAGSSRLLEKVGFQREGLIRSAYVKRGRLVDSVAHGLTIETWRAVNNVTDV